MNNFGNMCIVIFCHLRTNAFSQITIASFKRFIHITFIVVFDLWLFTDFYPHLHTTFLKNLPSCHLHRSSFPIETIQLFCTTLISKGMSANLLPFLVSFGILRFEFGWCFEQQSCHIFLKLSLSKTFLFSLMIYLSYEYITILITFSLQCLIYINSQETLCEESYVQGDDTYVQGKATYIH